MQLPQGFLEELRARTPLVELVGRRVRLSRSGRQWKGCCPFHDEKTPSFQVYDDHFHCYGCGAHGDAISFVMQAEAIGFMEAVAELAARAGLAVPEASPEAAAREAMRQDAFSVLEAAARIFAGSLWSPEGKAALAYLRERGLAEPAIREFGLGWSGEGRGALRRQLAEAGFAEARMLEGGLLREDQKGGLAEFFFSRIMFPIRDSRGRCLSFGARAIGEAQPKYLNGPETELFAKRRTLYGLDRAREALKSAPPIVVEGYVDVIAAHQAGFASAVAPLGTALTEEQLGVLWRFSETPVIAFDGDSAGARAAGRVAELALPLIGPGRSLAFALLPSGEDPDSLIRRGGGEQFRAAIAAAEPLSQALFRIEKANTGDATPEQRALLLSRLSAQAARIADRDLALDYRRTLRGFFFTSPARRPAPKPARRPPSANAADLPRKLIAILLRQPAVIAELAEALSQLSLAPPLARLRSAILQYSEELPELDSDRLIAQLNAAGLSAEVREALAETPLPVCRAGISPAEAREWWREGYDILVTEPRLKADVAAKQREFAAHPDPAREQQLLASKRELDQVRRGAGDDGKH